MITIKDIIENSKPHSVAGGSMTRLSNDKYILSIVGVPQVCMVILKKTLRLQLWIVRTVNL